MKPVVLSQKTRLEALFVAREYKNIAPSLGWRFERAMDNAILNIRRQPKAWPIFHKNFRKYILKPFPYALAYKELEEVIEVYDVVALRRKPGYWLEKK